MALDDTAGRCTVAEVYPSLWRRGFAPEGRTSDQHDAFCIAVWLSCADRDGALAGFFKPDLSPAERAVAEIEGMDIGSTGLNPSSAARTRRVTGDRRWRCG